MVKLIFVAAVAAAGAGGVSYYLSGKAAAKNV
jgi:hypothetical protein